MDPVSRLGLGTATLGNLHRQMSGERARAILATAWAVGVRHFDTAPHYGLGLAERRLGSFLHGRHGFTVSTKVGRLLRPDPDWAGGLDPEGFAVPAAMRRAWDVSGDGLRRSLEESLERTGLDRVDVAYLHDPERSGSDLPPDQVVTRLVRLRDEGLVGAVGVASMSTRALTDYTATGALDVVMVAGRHTLLDQSAAAEVFPHCRRHGTRVVAAAVFNSGLLSDPSPGATSLFDYAPASEELLERTRRIAAACREEGVPVATAALQFPLLDPLVSHVVVGAAEPGHVRADVAAVGEPVPASLWDRLRDTGVLV